MYINLRRKKIKFIKDFTKIVIIEEFTRFIIFIEEFVTIIMEFIIN